jgi:alkylation response protein AidB-like acyl-CoA dehydrogenase
MLLTRGYFHCNLMATTDGVTEEQKDWFFPQYMENHTLTMGGTYSEPSGNTDLTLPYDEPPGTALKVLAHKEGKEWVINGDKMFSSLAGPSDLFVVAARTDKNKPVTEAMSLFWVRKDTPGVTMQMNKILGAGLTGNVQTHFDNVRVPENQIIMDVNKAYYYLQSFNAKKFIPQPGLVGGLQKLYEQLRDYAKQRVQGGKPIIQHSSVAEKLGEAAIYLEAARAYLYRTAWETDQWEKNGGPVNIFWSKGAFYYLKKFSMRFCEIAVDIYGGIGLSTDLPIAHAILGTFGALPQGGLPSYNAIECSKAYDERFNYMLWEK